ncbi:hypothetical protein [Corynebacterium occultum]|uniref:hypothetical protein n=1 Tax=Corynebacterium occultum TaxID=2675219 RepID=UPI0012E2BBC4|nr:hypothetical protein [Corynebacterium occultum]
MAALLLGATALMSCASEEAPADSTTAVATTATVTESLPPAPAPTTVTETTPEMTSESSPAETSDPWVGIPGSRFVEEIADVPEIDSSPFVSSLIFPSQPGLQFQGPDGTYCEMYAEEDPTAMCSHEGEGDINAVSVHQGEPATTHNVNRIFFPHEQTQVLQPGSRVVHGPVSCAIPEGDVRVMCAIDFYSFAVSQEGVELS